MRIRRFCLLSLSAFLALPCAAPQTTAPSLAAFARTAVPPLIPYSGIVEGHSGPVTATFLIYKEETGGEPLFAETQTVAVDATGHYKAQLGATLTDGIPMDLFATGEARWLEVQAAGEAALPRVLLVSVPYALKAADAATLGGLPPSAFALARPASEAASAVSPAITPNVTSNVTTTGGIAGYVPEFSGVSSVVDSPIFINTTGEVGIGTTTPTATLDVNGSTTLNGQLLLPATGISTATKGFNSQLFKIYTSAFNSSSNAVVIPRFEWQGEVTGNDTATPGATLNLLSSTTASNATETGFYFNANGTIHFAPGQTFPGGTGTGTISGVTAGSALTGGGNSGIVTLSLDTTKVPLLAANNTFTGNQTIAGNLSTSGTASAGIVNAATAFDLGGSLFAFGSLAAQSVYLGFAGNSSTTGSYNTAAGFQALYSNTTGGANTASGVGALTYNTTGSNNTATGPSTLYSNTGGSFNTANGVNALYRNSTASNNVGIGYNAGTTVDASAGIGSGNTAVGAATAFSTGSITNATAIGANAEATQSNTLVLGCTAEINGCPNAVDVGIGTTAPSEMLDVAGTIRIEGGLDISAIGGNIGFNRNAATGAIYNPAYIAYQIGQELASTGGDFVIDQFLTDGSYSVPFIISKTGQLGLGGILPDPSAAVSVGGNVKIAAAGSGIVFADGTTQTTATLVGPTGPTGQRGLQGIPGTPGATGQQGKQGIQGIPGPTGAAGYNGCSCSTQCWNVSGPGGHAASMSDCYATGTNFCNGYSSTGAPNGGLRSMSCN